MLKDSLLESKNSLRFVNLIELNLSRNRLTRVPDFVNSIRAPKLEILSLAYNQIRVLLPQNLPSFTLKDLDVSNNRLDLSERDLRDVICISCLELSSLNLENNSISRIPCEFALMSLRAFLISGNPQRTVRVLFGSVIIYSLTSKKKKKNAVIFRYDRAR